MTIAHQSLGFSDEDIKMRFKSASRLRFTGMDLEFECAPDATTLSKFHPLLEEHKPTVTIFKSFNNRHLVERIVVRSMAFHHIV